MFNSETKPTKVCSRIFIIMFDISFICFQQVTSKEISTNLGTLWLLGTFWLVKQSYMELELNQLKYIAFSP